MLFLMGLHQLQLRSFCEPQMKYLQNWLKEILYKVKFA
ncbi:hypothetical protein T01_8258 [Trichinella spiralis]|uniref:Uncharacterized protein n=1 Tax=Trichinella spiralis TaxID=6334 RepID=A0A0V0Z530_TRISP|nr:hypothetical protein T01_8258 [Trichinella spiralis]